MRTHLFENLGKRQVKAAKVYVRDSGPLHALLGISSRRELEHHPKVGASWEGYAVEEVLKALRPDETYYWATHAARKWTSCCSRTDAASPWSASTRTRPSSRLPSASRGRT